MKPNLIASALIITIIVALSGCSEITPGYYCGCPEYEYKGTIKDFNINIDNGFLVTTEYCHITIDSGEKIFIQGGICEEMKYNWHLYKSRNRDRFYAVCDPNKDYGIKDKCEYEINDVNNATTQALVIKNGK